MSVKLAALLMLNSSSEMRGIPKEVLQKYLGKENEKSRMSRSVYIVDILVMIVFFANHNVTLVYLY